ncbi:anti-sigma factor RsbA family regulatory protein [Actinomadura gamaensis]|uniref:Anti-sigma factor RsbA family regulatory protein n=1 Tax=Actinomadura gamaensis TaxID=1763541 RepID=A0ABV9TYG5_9ACTN
MSTRSEAVQRARADFHHPALFYRGAEEYLAGLLPFIHGGLEAGEPVAAAVPEPNLRLLRDHLGPDADRVRLLDMGRAGRNPGRIIPGVLRAFADAHPGRRVRIVGEPIWPDRSAEEYPACLQHEALINLAFAGRPVTIVCPYDAVRLEARVLTDAAATHPVLSDPGGERPSDAYAADRVIADCNRPLPDPGTAPAAVLRFDEDALIQARDLASAHADRAGLGRDRVLDVELAVAELAANSLAHGGGHGTLRIWTLPSHLVCEVSDRGHLTDPLAGRHPVPPTSVGGRGLLLVNQLADLVRLHTRPDGTTVRAYFAR